MLPVAQIKCPQGIRFECSCCSNCCLEWPVPLTAKDYERIQSQPGLTCATEALGSRAGSPGNLLSFSHILKKNAAGACEFLQPDKHCRIHIEQGAEAKPSMCRLFPYSFIVTPDEVLASVSFAASAVLSNSGRLLSHQPETLAEQYQLFQQLFAAPVSLWHKLQIIDGLPISWEEFCRLDIDALISGDCPDTETVPPGMIKKLALASAKVLLELPDKNAAEKEPRLESRPRIIDQILLKHLEKLYFPDQVFSETNYDLNARALMQELVSAPQAVSFGQADHSRKFADLIKIKLGKLPDDVEDLLNRFFYVRFFSRLFWSRFSPFQPAVGPSSFAHLNCTHALKNKAGTLS